jgi:transposase
MIRLNFTEEDAKIFQRDRFHHPHPRVMLKMEVLHLKALGLSPGMICMISGVCHKTTCNYINEFNTGGIEKVREVNFNRPKSQLTSQASSIEAYLTANPPSSILQASVMIAELTGIKRGVTQTRSFLKSLGFSFRKTGVVPSKALTDEKKTNSENSWMKN